MGRAGKIEAYGSARLEAAWPRGAYHGGGTLKVGVWGAEEEREAKKNIGV